MAAAPNKIAAKAGTAVKVTGRIIAADGSAPVGTVTVTDRGEVIATVELAAAAKGRVDIALPALGRGLHLIRTTFTGGDGYNDSRAAHPRAGADLVTDRPALTPRCVSAGRPGCPTWP